MDGINPDLLPRGHPVIKAGLPEEQASPIAKADGRYALALPMGLKPMKFNPQISSSFFGVYEV